MAVLKKVPEFLSNMTEDELFHWKLDGDNGIIEKAVEWGVIDELEKLLEATSEKKRYPRVLKPSTNPKLNGKLTWQADYTQKPNYEVSPVGFFEIKAKFIHDICGLPRAEKNTEPDFRSKIKAAAEKARAAKETATASTTDAIDEKLGFKK